MLIRICETLSTPLQGITLSAGGVGAVKVINSGYGVCVPNRWLDNDSFIEEGYRNALRQAEQLKCLDIIVDAKSFYDSSIGSSSVVNHLVDGLAEVVFDITTEQHKEMTFWILRPQYRAGQKILHCLETELDRNTKMKIDQVFGVGGDTLKKKFLEFEKGLEYAKPFREHLLGLIDERQYRKDSEVYKAAGISKYTYSKITSFKITPPHKPSKDTVAALSIGLKLSLDEAQKLYNSAGYYLGTTEFVDRVVRFFIEESLYEIDEVNYCLEYYGYPPLGERSRDDRIKFEIK